MRISNETIKGFNTDELIDFIADHRYLPDNVDLIGSDDFISLPTHIKDFIFILDFETEYEMNGIWTLLSNTIGNYIEEIVDSFNRTNNWEIASIIDQLAYSENEDKFDQLNEKLTTIILEKEFWNGVFSTIESKNVSQQ